MADVVDDADARIVQARDRPRFAFEPFAELRVHGNPIGQDFDRDVAIEPDVARAIDLTHPPRPEHREHFVGAKASARCKRHLG